MDKVKSLTIILTTAIIVTGCVATTYILIDKQRSLKSNISTTSNEAKAEGESGSSFKDASQDSKKSQNIVNTERLAVLSLSSTINTNNLISATCEVDIDQTCDLWGVRIDNQVEELYLKFDKATKNNIAETGKVQYTWDLRGKGTKDVYVSLQGLAYDPSGVFYSASSKTRL